MKSAANSGKEWFRIGWAIAGSRGKSRANRPDLDEALSIE